jgi:hypothetical protein
MWKIIIMLCDNEIDISHLDDSIIQELLQIVLPDGATFLSHLLENGKDELFENLLKRVKKSKYLKIYLVADIDGFTPLHICLDKTLSRASDKLLEVISKDPLSTHIDIIRDIIPELVRTSPQATCKYLDSRMMSCPWFHTSTKGDLNQNYYADLLKPINEDDLENKIFDYQQGKDNNKRLPI